MKAEDFVLTDISQFEDKVDFDEKREINPDVWDIYNRWYDFFTSCCNGYDSTKAAFSLFNALNEENDYELGYCLYN